GCFARLWRSRRREDAACLEGGGADDPAAAPARSDGGWRARRDLGAGQSLSLSARAIRARQPDRALPEDEKAALEADPARCQGCFLQTEIVPERVAGALPGPYRMGIVVIRRQGQRGRSGGAD